jgi:hypothetical protein
MRRQLMTLALTGLFGAIALSSDASACCHKRQRCAPAPCVAACPAPAPAPCPAPEPCAAPARKCCFKMPKFHGFCHKRQACAAPVVCETPVAAPVYYAPAPSPQVVVPSGQAPSGQS